MAINENSHMPEGFFRMRLSPKSDEELTSIADELLKWAQDEDGISLEEYCSKKLFLSRRLYEWSERHEYLRDCIRITLQILGSRREKAALIGKFNANLVMQTMPLYNKQYKKLVEWKANLNKPQESKQEIHVHMDSMPLTKMVPDKGKKLIDKNEDEL